MQNLVDSLKNRDASAYRSLYATFNKDLIRFANTYLYDKDLAKDIVQESFVYIWENSEKLSINISLKSYLYATVKNKCLNELKKLKVYDNAGLLDFMARMNSDHYEEIYSEKDEHKTYVIEKVIKELPKKMREIVRMKYFKEYSHSEIADELDISVNTVKTQLKRAKSKMLNKLVSDTGMRVVGFLMLIGTTFNFF